MEPWSVTIACPSCHTSLPLNGERYATCAQCGFQPAALDGTHSFVPNSGVNVWQEMFETKSASTVDDSTVVAYRFGAHFNLVVDAFGRAFGPLKSDARVLDVGCGSGLFWQSLGRHPHTVGVDYSIGMCSRARARGLQALHADAYSLPFADNQFDLVYSAEVLQYVTDLSGLFLELTRVCRPGGRIVVSTPNSRSIVRRINRFIHPPSSDWENPNILRTATDVISIAESAHLSLDSAVWIHTPLMLLHRSRSANYIGDSLASNIVLAFINRPGIPNVAA